MPEAEDDVYCLNRSELLFRILRREDGTTVMKDPAGEPSSDGVQKYFLCPTCHGKNLAIMLIEDPPGSRYYEIAGFIRS